MDKVQHVVEAEVFEARCRFVMRDRSGEEYPCGAVARIHGNGLGQIFTHEFVWPDEEAEGK